MGNSVSQPENKQLPDSWTNSSNRIVQFTHHWVLENFNFHLNTSKTNHRFIKSSTFSQPNEDTTKFYFSLYPNGTKEEEKSHVYLCLFLDSCSKPELGIQVRASIIDKDRNKQNNITITDVFKPEGSGWAKPLINHSQLLNNINQLLPDGKLTLVCEFKIIVDSITTSGRYQTFQPAETKIVDNLSRLFETRKLSDIILVTGNTIKTEHRVHKLILCAQSEVFAAMFEHDTKESRECRVEIEDIEAQVMTEMLRFIYTGKVQDFDVLADKLLIAADKYGLVELKSQCEQNMTCKLTPENVVDCLLLADKHSADKLRTKAIEYINGNLSTIMKTDSWKAIEEQPKLYMEIFNKIMEDKVKIN